MKKIIYLIEQPLDERNYDRFGIQTWLDRGWDVEVWDLTPLAYPRVWQNYIEAGHKFKEFSGYFPIASQIQLKRRCSGLEKIGYFVDLTGDNLCSVRAKMSLRRMKAVRVICATGSVPGDNDSQKWRVMSKLQKAISKGPIKSFKWLINALVCKLTTSSIRPGFVVISGKKSISSFSTGPDHEIIKAHNFDYDIYLKLNKTIVNADGNYAVFIDQDYCFNPDYLHAGIPAVATPERYFPVICSALKKISEILKVEVRVAAHPRSTYQHSVHDYFEGISVEYGRTAELVKNCKVVVCHNSTAIQFAVLFEKPIIFLTTNELDISPNSAGGGKSIAVFASELGKSAINLDGDLDRVNWHNELSVDHEKYAEYRKNYIKIDGSPEKPHWDIVIDHIEKC